MLRPIRFITTCLLLVLLAGCGSTPINAPVGSRGPDAAGRPPVRRSAPERHPDYYQVRAGDTLYSIAWQYGLSYQQLASINAIRPPFTIYTGQRLRIRSAGSRPAASPEPPLPPVATPTRVPAPAPVAPPPAQAEPVRSGQAASAAAPAPAYDGNWQWPVRGALLRKFNPDAPGKKGIDIAGNPGQPVKAAANGRVVYTGSGLVGYGRLIIVKHDDSLLSAYGHNSKLLVAEGDHVTAGQVIARMGHSGTHRTELYFEVRKDGKPVDPLQYLPRT